MMRKQQQFKPAAGKWVGVDFDRTLVTDYPGSKLDEIGQPVTAMVERVRRLLAAGVEVRIFTARVSHPFVEFVGEMPDKAQAEAAMLRYHDAMKQKAAIEKWCQFWLKAKLKVTCVKDHNMVELWDDRAVQVAENLGVLMGNGSRFAVAEHEEEDV